MNSDTLSDALMKMRLKSSSAGVVSAAGKWAVQSPTFEGAAFDGAGGVRTTVPSLSAALRARRLRSELMRVALEPAPDAARREGILIAQEMLEPVKPLVQGVQVSAPFGRYTAAAEVIASVLPPTA